MRYYLVQTRNNASGWLTEQQKQNLETALKNPKNVNMLVTIGQNMVRVGDIREVIAKSIENLSDAPNYFQQRVAEEQAATKDAPRLGDGRPSGDYVGLLCRFFAEDGTELDHDPFHDGEAGVVKRNGEPKPYVQIDVPVYSEKILEPFGNQEVDTIAYGEPKRELYIRFKPEHGEFVPTLWKKIENGKEDIYNTEFRFDFKRPDLSVISA